jgi:hypothetical protein
MGSGGNSLRSALAQIKDFTTSMDKLASTMSESDVARALNAKEATGDLKAVSEALDDVYNTHAKVLDQLNKAYKINRARINNLKEESRELRQKKKLTAEEKDHLASLIGSDGKSGLLGSLKKREDELKNLRIREIKERTFSNKIDKDRIKNQTWLVNRQKEMGMIMKRVAPVIIAYAAAFDVLEQVHKRVFKWQGDLQKSLSTLALRFGTTTEAVVEMRQEALTQLLDVDGLGGLGLSLEEITSQLGDFNEALSWTRKVSQPAAAEMIKLARGVGMSAQQVGEFSHAFMVAGQSVDDVKKFMKSIATEAARAGVNTASLGKQFTGAGRALFDMSGPKARMELVKTARELAKMGTGLDKIAGFTEMTDVFDKTAEGMARINTAFGTHINAMEVFSERNPEKRLKMLTDQMAAQGMTVEMMRQEKKLLAETLGMDAQTVDSLLTRSTMTEEQLQAEREMGNLAAKKLEAEQAFEKSIMRSKQALVAEQAIAANINNMLTKQMAPFYDAFADGGGLVEGAGMFDSYTKKWVATINTISRKLGEQGIGASLSGIGRTFGKIWDTIMDFISSDSMAAFITGLVGAFEIVSDVIGAIITVISPVLKGILWVIGKALEFITVAWKFAKMFVSAGWAGLTNMAGEDGSMGKAAGSAWDTGEKEYSASGMGLFGMGEPVATSDAMVTRAGGGTMRPGQMALVGENGPELFTSEGGGTVTPASTTAAALNGASNATINVQVILDGEIIQEKTFKQNLRSIQ